MRIRAIPGGEVFSARKGFIRLLNSLSSLSTVRFLILRSDFVAILLSHFLKYDDAYLKIGGQLLKTRRKKATSNRLEYKFATLLRLS